MIKLVSGSYFCIKSLRFTRILKAFFCITIAFLILYIYFGEFEGTIENDAILWFKHNRNLSEFIKPDVETSILFPDPINTCQDDNILIVYFISSAPQNHLHRKTIRRTWGNDLKGILIFLTGIVDNKEEMEILRKEAQFYQDIIIENFHDTYNNLTLKTGFIFKNFIKLCPSAKYLMKADDDIFLNPELITQILLDHEETDKSLYERPSLIGHRFETALPYRSKSSKWFMPLWMYPDKFYPKYLAGFAFMLPQFTVKRILNTALNFPMVHMEDVYYTGIIANKLLNYQIINDNRFLLSNPLVDINCFYRNFAAVHHIGQNKLINIWKEINTVNNCNTFGQTILDYLFLVKN